MGVAARAWICYFTPIFAKMAAEGDRVWRGNVLNGGELMGFVILIFGYTILICALRREEHGLSDLQAVSLLCQIHARATMAIRPRNEHLMRRVSRGRRGLCHAK